MQACIGIKQSLQQDQEAYRGAVCLETMMMLHLSGQWSGSQPLEFLNFVVLQQIHLTQVIFSEGKIAISDEPDCSFKGTQQLELMRNEMEHNTLSHSKTGPKELWPSISNYVLQLSSSNDSELPVAFLYFMDSGGGSYPEVISKTEAEWFQQKSHDLNPDSRVPEIIFWHIPSKVYAKVAPTFLIFTSCVGSINKESVAAQEAEMGVMELLEKRPSVKAVFVGHNHGLDWCCPHKKLWLCFARHTGYGGYGNWPRGARILEITQQPFSLKSWIRMEDGHSHSEVILSS
ncbi:putative inactive purple acid phosphatase 16 [Sarracenia purpurea var. burkii]